MKEIGYNGDLEQDINRLKNQLDIKNKRTLFIIIGTTISEFFIFAIVILMMNGFTLSSLIGMGLFGLLDVSVKLVNINHDVCKIRLADERLKFLTNWLEYHNVFVEKKDLLAATKVEECVKTEVMLEKNGKQEILLEQDKKVQYFSLLDRNNKLQVLKLVRSKVLSSNEFKYVSGKSNFKGESEQLFFLEDDDIRNMDSHFKRVLRRSK